MNVTKEQSDEELYEELIITYSAKLAYQTAKASLVNKVPIWNEQQISITIQQISQMFNIPFQRVKLDIDAAVETHDTDEMCTIIKLKNAGKLH